MVEEATRILHGAISVHIKEFQATVENDQGKNFRIDTKVSFLLERKWAKRQPSPAGLRRSATGRRWVCSSSPPAGGGGRSVHAAARPGARSTPGNPAAGHRPLPRGGGDASEERSISEQKGVTGQDDPQQKGRTQDARPDESGHPGGQQPAQVGGGQATEKSLQQGGRQAMEQEKADKGRGSPA